MWRYNGREAEAQASTYCSVFCHDNMLLTDIHSVQVRMLYLFYFLTFYFKIV